jgi:hypothetical protein
MQQKSLIWGMRWPCSGASVFSYGSGLIDDGEQAQDQQPMARGPCGVTPNMYALYRVVKCNAILTEAVARGEEQAERAQEDGACRDWTRGYGGSLR